MGFKLVGACLLLGAGVLGGQLLTARLRRRPEELAALERALAALETEMAYLATPLAPLLAQLAQRLPASLAPLFAQTAAQLNAGTGITAAEAWAAVLKTMQQGPSTLISTDWQILAALGAYLGASDLADQRRHLRYAQSELAAARAAAQAYYHRFARLYGYFGVAAPLILVLWLW